MKVNPHGYPSFLKTYVGEARYWERIHIPSSFVKAHKNKLVERTWVLKTEDGTSWDMEIKRQGAEYFFRRAEWENLAKHHNLRFGDQIMFFLVGNSEFEVMLYTQTPCCRILLPKHERSDNASSEDLEIEDSRKSKKHKKSKGSDTDEEISDTGSEEEEEEVQKKRYSTVNLVAKNPYFQTVVKQSHKWAMCVPIDFARKTGIIRQKALELTYENGKTKEMKIVYLDNRVQLTSGWKSFRKANKIKDGDKCLFTLVNSGRKGIARMSVKKL